MFVAFPETSLEGCERQILSGIMTYTFRVPFGLPGDQRIAWPHTNLELSFDNERRVRLKANQTNEVCLSSDLALIGDGYPSKEQAFAAGEQWLGWVAFGLIDCLVGMNVNDYVVAPSMPLLDHLNESLLDEAKAQFPNELLQADLPGLSVHLTKTPLKLYAITNEVAVQRDAQTVVDRILKARSAELVLDAKLRRASAAFSLALALPTVESRFVMLITAIEVLLERGERPAATRALVSDLNLLLDASDLDSSERQSVAAALNELNVISIGKAGRNLATRLGSNVYMDMTATKFWGHAYALRSRMSHGDLSTELTADVRLACEATIYFFRDLILLLAKSS